DGIRDDLVTGVQTCALPISFLRKVNDAATGLADRIRRVAALFPRARKYRAKDPDQVEAAALIADPRRALAAICIDALEPDLVIRSEERRVGKGCRTPWSRAV